MIVLGIETSCDETAVALYCSQAGLIAHKIYSQITLHQPYGGVVPELAARDHIRKVLPLIQVLLQEVGLSKEDLQGVAFTKGPGLIGALMVGAAFGRTLGFALDVPTIGVHHMEAHLLAVMLEEKRPQFPFLGLLVSGGHTLLIEAKSLGHYVLLGESLDDAVGEAFDKVAKLLGLPYPGGPSLAKLAEKGNPHRFHFPRPLLKSADFNFSFSGLKTHALQTLQKMGQDDQTRADIACAFEEAVVAVLIEKCKRALAQTGHRQLVMVGGVSANQKLRTQMPLALQALPFPVTVFYPQPVFCTDNAAMVAYTGCQRLLRGEREELSIQVKPRWNLMDLL